MFRNTLCEAEPDEPGERSAFGAIRTGIELCKRQPRGWTGSSCRERKSKCSSFCPPYSAVFGIPAVQAMTGIVSPTA